MVECLPSKCEALISNSSTATHTHTHTHTNVLSSQSVSLHQQPQFYLGTCLLETQVPRCHHRPTKEDTWGVSELLISVSLRTVALREYSVL
jgi:hypothetical protein